VRLRQVHVRFRQVHVMNINVSYSSDFSVPIIQPTQPGNVVDRLLKEREMTLKVIITV
jgi:hypothetical protein